MKIVNYIVIILLLQFAFPTNKLSAQSKKNIHADNKYFWDKHHKWNDRNTDFYNFKNLNGKMVALKAYKSGVTNHHSQIELYTYNHQDKEFNFTKHIEDIEHVELVIAKPLAFEFAGRNFIMSLFKKNGLHKRKLYYTKTASLETWHSKQSVDAHDISKLKLYRDAWYSGDSIYLTYYSYYKKDGSGDEKLHYYHDILVDVGVITHHNNLKIIRTIHMDNVMEYKYFEPFAIQGFVHADGKPRLLISYTDELADDELNKGGGTIVCNPATGSFKHLHKATNFRAIRAIHGSIKARLTHPSGDTNDLRNNPNRIQVFYNYFDNNDNRGHYYYRTYAIDGEHYHLTAHGRINHHDKELPDDWNGLSMEVSSRYVPHNSADGDQSNDAFHQDLWLFRVNKKHLIFADIFKSDQWKSNNSTILTSHDLINTDETTGYGSAIRSLWTLIGITEGAPPASINWEEWHNEYPNQFDPTSLKFKTSTSDEVKISQTYHRSFYTETGIAVGGDKKKAIFHASFKFINAHRHTQTDAITTTNSITENYALTEDSQSIAKLIWSVPDINRISYAIYPWWDENYEYPQDASTSFMFYSPSSQLVYENRSISSKPFYVSNPNESTMEDWKTDTSATRETISLNAARYQIQPIATTWLNNNHGTTASIVSETTHTEEVSKSHSFDINAGGGLGIPKVFKINEDLNWEWGYENTDLHATTISKNLEVSLENMLSAGINLNSLNVETYFFDSGRKDSNGDEINWWYYDDFVDEYGEGHKPWYITHIVTGSSKVPIIINKPSKDGFFDKIPKINWSHPVKEAHRYSILFSSSHRFEPNKTIEIKTKNLKYLEANRLKDHIPFNTKTYWVIKAINEKNEVTWSKIRWIEIKSKEETVLQLENELNFIIYPNPTTESIINLNFTNDISEQTLFLSLYTITGNLLINTQIHSSKIKDNKYLLDLSINKSGIYTVTIKGENTIKSNKLIIK